MTTSVKHNAVEVVIRNVLRLYDAGPRTDEDRLTMWRTVGAALLAAGFTVQRNADTVQPAHGDGSTLPTGAVDKRTINRLQRGMTALAPLERVQLLYITAPDLSDPEWPSLLAEFVDPEKMEH